MTPHLLFTFCPCSVSKPTSPTGMWSVTSMRSILETSASSQSECVCCSYTNRMIVSVWQRMSSFSKQNKFPLYSSMSMRCSANSLLLPSHSTQCFKSPPRDIVNHLLFSDTALCLQPCECFSQKSRNTAPSSSTTTIERFLCFPTKDKQSYSGTAVDWYR